MKSLWFAVHMQLCLAGFYHTTSASAVYAIVVCLSVCLSQVGVLLRRLNVGSRRQRHMIAQESSFLMPKISAKLKWGHPQGSAICTWGRLKLATFDK